MASVLDLGLLGYFSVLFPALLVWVVVFAILQKIKILGEGKGIHAVVATVLAFVVVASDKIVTVIGFISPWFVLLFIFGFLLLVMYRLMGVPEETISKFISTDAPVIWFIFGISILIIVAGLANVYGQGLLTGEGSGNVSKTAYVTGVSGEGTATASFAQNLSRTFFHPKIIGLLLIFLIAVFTISLLARH